MSSFVSTDGTRIGYSKIGSGPAVILVDGAMCYRGASPLTPLAGLLAGAFTVYTYDRRGRGESGDTPPYDVSREIDDLAKLIDEAGGSAAVYGVSSGGVLGLLGARRGLAITKLGLFEPPLATNDRSPAKKTLVDELSELIAADRRGDAVEHFQTAIGLPPEMVVGMRNSPYRPALEAIAPTLVYDTTITISVTLGELSTIRQPAIVIDSGDTSATLRESAAAVGAELPAGEHMTLPGQFHDVPAEVLAPVLTRFFGRE